MHPCSYPIAELLPHAPPMVLLDAVIASEPGKLSAVVDIRTTSRFYLPERGVPAHVGIEYMAQACGAYAGLEARKAGKPIRMGFLLGTRHYASTVSWFQAGERLVVSVIEVLRQGSMGVLDCRIERAGAEVATARLNVYQPDDAAPDEDLIRSDAT
jgi:predicted hotdog family 3-hydroxylacyl-ACP dehydratase